MSRRDREAWEAMFGILVLVGAVLVGIGVYEAAVTEISVPLLWPLAATAGCLWAGYLVLSRHVANERRLAAEDLRRTVSGPAAPRTVADVINAPFRTAERIGDVERDVFVSALHSHSAAGRLDQAELDERLAAALAAKTVTQLAAAVRDLPDEVTGR